MKQRQSIFILRTLILLASLYFIPFSNEARAEVEIFKVGGEGSFSVEGEVVARNSYWSWFQSEDEDTDKNYDYFFTRSRLGLSLDQAYIGAYIQAQDVHMWNLPDHSWASSPQGPLGIGSIYYLHRGNDISNSLIIRQAYLDFPRVFVKGLSARVGRFDYLDGQEVMYKNPKVNWLKRIRLSERLVGPFGWSSFNRSFDGIQLAYDGPGFNLHSTATRPTQGGFENDAQNTMSGIDLLTLTGTAKYDEWLPRTEGRVFYYYYNDNRNISATPGTGGLNEGNIRINTFGTHWLRTESVRNGVFDMLFWGAIQEGEWGALDHEAWAMALEGGFQSTQAPLKPWIRGGYFVSSGDTDPEDGKHETFYQLLPTARKYALFPFYNMMNNEDLFLQAVLRPKDSTTIRADLHFLNLHEEADLWYMGAGPTQGAGGIFGYIGRPSFGAKDLATVFEVVVSHTFSKYFSANVYFGHAFGKDVIDNIYDADDGGDFFSLEFKAQF